LRSIQWFLEEHRPLWLTVVIASIVLAVAYFLLGPPNAGKQARRQAELLADCRTRYAQAKSRADSALVDAWPSANPPEGRKIPERNELFTCGAYRRRGEV
jgi:hypothetical protein